MCLTCVKCIITCGKWNKKKSSFFIGPIFYFIKGIFESKVDKEAKNSFFYKCFLQFFSLAFCGVLWMLNEKRKQKKSSNKKENTTKENDNNNNNKEDEKNNNDKQNQNEQLKKFQLKFLIFVSAFIAISQTYSIYASSTQKYADRTTGVIVTSYFFHLLSGILLSHFLIEKAKLYKHHKFSIIGMIIILFILNLNSYSVNKDIDAIYSIYFLIYISEILSAFEYVIGGFFLLQTEKNINKLCFYIGIAGLIFIIFLQLFFYIFNFNCKKIFINSIEDNCKGEDFMYLIIHFTNFTKFQIFKILIILIINFGLFYSKWYIVNHFSPNHSIAIESICYLLLIIIEKSNDKDDKYIGLYILGSIIFIILTLVYNEIIILKFWDLDKDTKEEIEKRKKEEANLILDKENGKKIELLNDEETKNK